jgi:hypothetical protein
MARMVLGLQFIGAEALACGAANPPAGDDLLVWGPINL